VWYSSVLDNVSFDSNEFLACCGFVLWKPSEGIDQFELDLGDMANSTSSCSSRNALSFLKREIETISNFFLLAKPINPPLSHYCDERSILKRIRKYHRFVLPAASLFCQNGKFVCILTRRFLLVLQYPEELAFTMRLVTYIGITISLALLLAAFILFLCLR